MMLHRFDKVLTTDFYSDAAYCCILRHYAAYCSIMLQNFKNAQNLFYGSCQRANFSLTRNIDHEPIIEQKEMEKEKDLIYAN